MRCCRRSLYTAFNLFHAMRCSETKPTSLRNSSFSFYTYSVVHDWSSSFIIMCHLQSTGRLSWISIVLDLVPLWYSHYMTFLSIPWCYPSTLFSVSLVLFYHLSFLPSAIVVSHLLLWHDWYQFEKTMLCPAHICMLLMTFEEGSVTLATGTCYWDKYNWIEIIETGQKSV